MDQKKIEEGLKRLNKAVELEEEEKRKTRQDEEKEVHTETVEVLSKDKEAEQNAIMKEKHPEDLCPVCHTHVVDARYLVLPQLAAIVCGNCTNIFMPQSRYDAAVDVMKNRIDEKESSIVMPKKNVIPAVNPL